MTGLTLLAFEPGDPELLGTLSLAARMTGVPGSSEAQSWLSMALAHHKCPAPKPATDLPCRTHRDVALRILASAGRANPLLA
jgi:hypothetical protein